MDHKTHTDLSQDEISYYQRQLIIPDFGIHAQLQLKNAKVLIIGLGGLGCPAAQYLTAVGIGKLGFIDPDVVSLNNLQRQILYSVGDVGQKKVEVAKRKLEQLNPYINIEAIPEQLTEINAKDIFKEYDIVVDGTDNFPTRYLVNDTCVLLDKVNVYASILRYEGQVSVFNVLMENGKRSSNYRDLFPDIPAEGSVPNCSEAGILGTVAGILGTQQANEVIKLITKTGNVLMNQVLILHLKQGTSHIIKLDRNTQYPKEVINELETNYVYFCAVESDKNIEIVEFKKCLSSDDCVLVDVRTKEEFLEYNIGGINIPLDEIKSRKEELKKESKIVFLCQSGNRSKTALKTAELLGLKNVFHLEGGINLYKSIEVERRS